MFPWAAVRGQKTLDFEKLPFSFGVFHPLIMLQPGGWHLMHGIGVGPRTLLLCTLIAPTSGRVTVRSKTTRECFSHGATGGKQHPNFGLVLTEGRG